MADIHICPPNGLGAKTGATREDGLASISDLAAMAIPAGTNIWLHKTGEDTRTVSITLPTHGTYQGPIRFRSCGGLDNIDSGGYLYKGLGQSTVGIIAKEHVWFEGIHFRDFANQPLSFPSAQVMVRNCKFENIFTSGWVFGGSGFARLLNNTFTNVTSSTSGIYSGNFSIIQNNLCINLSMYYCFNFGTGGIVVNNVIRGTFVAPLVVGNYGALFQGNIIMGAKSAGSCAITAAYGSVVTGNIIYDCLNGMQNTSNLYPYYYEDYNLFASVSNKKPDPTYVDSGGHSVVMEGDPFVDLANHNYQLKPGVGIYGVESPLGVNWDTSNSKYYITAGLPLFPAAAPLPAGGGSKSKFFTPVGVRGSF